MLCEFFTCVLCPLLPQSICVGDFNKKVTTQEKFLTKSFSLLKSSVVVETNDFIDVIEQEKRVEVSERSS